jgi:hypothetical protein
MEKMKCYEYGSWLLKLLKIIMGNQYDILRNTGIVMQEEKA